MKVAPPIGIDAVFDIETEDWSTYVTGAILDSSGRYFSTRDPEALAACIGQVEGDVWAHNGGRYDALWLLDVLDRWRTPWRANMAGARIVSLTFGKTTVRDSYALVPMRLEDCAPLGGMRKSATGFPCVCGAATAERPEGCGGYCSIRRAMPEADYRKLDGYLENDCRATMAMLRAVAGFLEGEEIELRGTVGSTAWAGARGMLDLPAARWNRGAYQLARGGYYGGRVEVFQPVADRAYMYDRNSSYPAALVETPVPVGEPTATARNAARSYASGLPGIVRCEVEVPEAEFPPLPVRLGDSLAYPYGRFRGCWTALELAAAEARGARILRVDYGVFWPRAERILAPWCERVWKLRDAATPVWAKWLKWLANALTGKVSQKPERELMEGGPPKPKPWEPVGPSLRIWKRPIFRIAACGHVQWGAYLTSSARLDLLLQMEAAPPRSVLYCDTDSDPSSEPQTRHVGSGLGEWKLEGVLSPWRCWAPKLYAAGGKVRGKGLPDLDATGLAAFAAGAPHVSRRGVAGLAAAAAAGGPLFRRRNLTRTCHADGLHFGSRILGMDGRTRARSYSDLTGDSQVVSSDDEGE